MYVDPTHTYMYLTSQSEMSVSMRGASTFSLNKSLNRFTYTKFFIQFTVRGAGVELVKIWEILKIVVWYKWDIKVYY